MREYKPPSRWPMVMLALLILGFIALSVWWLETRFGSGVAIMVVGGTLGVICVLAGWLLAVSNQKITLGSAAQFNDRLARTESERQRTMRGDLKISEQYARMEREAFNKRAALEAYEEKKVMSLAERIAGMMTQADRRAENNATTWDAFAQGGQGESVEIVDGDWSHGDGW